MSEPARAMGRRAWDPLVRLTHWIIVLAILINGLFLRDGSVAHVWIGYAALSALILRLLWGLIAPGPARLADMPLAPSHAIAHLNALFARRWHESPGHTPLGAWMAVALWLMLGLTTLSGLALEADPFPGDDTRHVWGEYHYEHDDDDAHEEDDDDHQTEDSASADLIEDLHEAAATALLILAALHVAGVGLESRLSRRNLAMGMIRNRHERSRR